MDARSERWIQIQGKTTTKSMNSESQSIHRPNVAQCFFHDFIYNNQRRLSIRLARVLIWHIPLTRGVFTTSIARITYVSTCTEHVFDINSRTLTHSRPGRVVKIYIDPDSFPHLGVFTRPNICIFAKNISPLFFSAPHPYYLLFHYFCMLIYIFTFPKIEQK